MEKLIRAKKEQELTLFLHTAGKEARHRETLLTVEVIFFFIMGMLGQTASVQQCKSFYVIVTYRLQKKVK